MIVPASARGDALEPGPLEAVAGAALEGGPGLPQRGPGSLELVREPQRVGEASGRHRGRPDRESGRAGGARAASPPLCRARLPRTSFFTQALVPFRHR